MRRFKFSEKVERKAARAYAYYVKHEGFGKRPKWDDLDRVEQLRWYHIEDTARLAYAHFTSLQQRRVSRELRCWNKLSQAERHIWRMLVRAAWDEYEKDKSLLNMGRKWQELSVWQQALYRQRAISAKFF